MAKNEVRIIGGLWKGRKLKLPGGAAVRPSLGRVRETLFNWLAGHVEGSDCLDLFAGSGALGFEALSRGARSAVLVDNSRGAIQMLHHNARRLGTTACSIRRQSALAFLRRAAEEAIPPPGSTTLGRETNIKGDSAAERRTPAKGDSRATGESLAGNEPAPRTAAQGEAGTGRTTNIDAGTVHPWDIVFLDPPFASNLLAASLDALRAGQLLHPGSRVYFELERRAAINPQGWTILKQGTVGDTQFGLLAPP